MPTGTNITLRDGTKGIAGYAFIGCNGLTNIEIPNTVTTIGSGAFHSCGGLTSVNIPNSVTTIGSFMFYGCNKLTAITIDSDNPIYDSRENCNAIIETATNSLIVGCKKSFIPNSVTTIGSYAFCGCRSLTNIEIPNSVTHIGDGAFYECSGLTNIEIPNSVTSINVGAFYECSGLMSIAIGSSLSSLRDAFIGCNELETITVDSENPYYDSRENCNAIIETATNSLIMGCKNSFIPNSVTAIGFDAFSGCNGLTNIEIPNSVTTIGSGAFHSCNGLTNIEIPNSVTTIGNDAFHSCGGLTNIEIPNSVTSIGDNAFCNCSGLTSVTIPNYVTYIGEGAFYGCSGLKEVYSYITDLPNLSMGDHVFGEYGKYSSTTLYVPNGMSADYQADTRWSQYFGFIVEMDPINATSIGLNKTNASITAGETMQLMAIVLPENTTNKSVAWSTSNSAVATVNDGLVTTIAPGTATITVMTTDGSNLGASCIVEVFNDMSQYSDYLSLTDVEAFHGDTIVIPVRMTNAANITAFQTDIFLPEGLEALQEDGEYIIDPSERMTRTHSIMSSDVSNGAIRVLCYSSNYKPFTGESGDELFFITVKVADDAKGDYTIALKNTLLTNTDFVDIAAPDVAATINVKAYLPGDANDSGTVTVGDVVVTAQSVLELNPQPFNFEAADVNEDSYITVADVARIAWMVLNPTAYAPMRAPALWNNCDRMSGESISLMPGETRKVSITLDNEMAYTAFQLDLNLPEGLTANNFSLTDRADSHAFDINMLESGMMRVLCYSPVLTAIGGHEGVLLTFDVTSMRLVNGDISVDGIELVTTGCQSVKLDGFAIGVNNASVVNELSAGKTIARVNYFNIAGQQIDSPENGVTLVVTTYTDGTRTTSKVIK